MLVRKKKVDSLQDGIQGLDGFLHVCVAHLQMQWIPPTPGELACRNRPSLSESECERVCVCVPLKGGCPVQVGPTCIMSCQDGRPQP